MKLKSKKVTAEEMVKAALSPFEEALDGEGLTVAEWAKLIKELRDAHEVKVFFDRESGHCVYSKKLIAYGPRAEAARILQSARGYKAPDQSKVDLMGGVSFTVKHESAEPVRKPGAPPAPVAQEDDLDG